MQYLLIAVKAYDSELRILLLTKAIASVSQYYFQVTIQKGKIWFQPALSPKRVIFWGSPPKLWTIFFMNFRASNWSFRPARKSEMILKVSNDNIYKRNCEGRWIVPWFPVTTWSPVFRKPWKYRKWINFSVYIICQL